MNHEVLGCCRPRFCGEAYANHSGYKLQDEIVPCDDRHFINCHLQDCDLQYDGGKLLFENTSFLRCKWTFGGPAVRTLMLVRTFNLKIGSEFSDPMASFSALAGPA